MKTKLVGSSNSIDQLRRLVDKYFYHSGISFISVSENEWEVHNSSKKIDGFRVIAKRGRYRFELLQGDV